MTSPTATRSNETDMGATPAPRPRARLAGALVAAAAGAALALTGCSAGQVTQTSSQAAAINGANVNAGSVMLRNVHLLYPAEGSDYSFERGGSAQISFVIVNNDPANDDTLLSITSDFGRVTLTPATVPAGGSLAAGIPVGQIVLEEGVGEVVTPTTTEAPEPDAEEGNAAPGAGADATGGLTVVLEDLESGVGPGISIRMVFTFENAGDVEVFVPVDAGAELDRDPEATWRTHEAH